MHESAALQFVKSGALTVFLRLAVSVLALQVSWVTVAAGQVVNDSEPLIVFVHGRGQDEKAIDDVRRRFIDTFVNAEQKKFGSEVVPHSLLRFAWYADVIDPNASKMPDSPNCRFATGQSATASFKKSLLDGLLKIASSLGLDDIALHAFAGDTYKYLTEPSVRCEADSRVSSILLDPSDAKRPKIIVAHSMGGIVAFSAIERLSTTSGLSYRPNIPYLITVGTQVGLPEILNGLEGSFVNFPMPLPNLIGSWVNFKNRGDKLAFDTVDRFKATDLTRLPKDIKIVAKSRGHAIENYLGNEDVVSVIVESWCATAAVKPTACTTKPNNDVRERTVSDIPTLGVAAGNLSVFFDVKDPNIVVSRRESTHLELAGSDSTVFVNEQELSQLQKSSGAADFRDILFFFLAHEFAHIAQSGKTAPGVVRASILVSECEADLWAGAAFIRAQPVVGDGRWAFERVKAVVAASAESGETLPDGVDPIDPNAKGHPDAVQRATCAAKGVSAALDAIARQLQFSRRPDGRKPPPMVLFSELEGFSSRPWSWSLETAAGVTGRTIPATEKSIPMIGRAEIASLARAAESGPTQLMKVHVLESHTAVAPHCVYEGGRSAARATCSYPAALSRRLAAESYDLVVEPLLPALMARGWQRGDATRSGIETVEKFRFGAASCAVSVNWDQRIVRLMFDATGVPIG